LFFRIPVPSKTGYFNLQARTCFVHPDTLTGEVFNFKIPVPSKTG